MAKLTVNKKYKELFDTVNRYQRALCKKKEAYLQLALNAEPHSTAQTDAFDAAFMLDFMMASNQQLIDYLDFLQKCNNSVTNKKLDSLVECFKKLEQNEDIHQLAQAMINQINNDDKQTIAITNYYQRWYRLDFTGAMLILGLAIIVPIFINPVGLMILPFVICTLALAILGGLLYVDYPYSVNKYHASKQHIEKLSNICEGIYSTTFDIDVKTESTDKKTVETKQETLLLSESKTKLKDYFFNKKHPHKSLTLADEVKEKYIALMK